jgi:hypothetical protein
VRGGASRGPATHSSIAACLGKKRRSGQRQQGKGKPPLVRPSKHSKRGVLAVVQEPTKAKKGGVVCCGADAQEQGGGGRGGLKEREKGTRKGQSS